MVTAFAGPSPLYLPPVSSAIVFLPSVLRLLLQSFITRFISPTAVSSVEPLPMSIASSSAFVNAAAPSVISFSRGRSSSAQSVMLSFSMPSSLYL